MECTRDIVDSIMDNLYCAHGGIFSFLFKIYPMTCAWCASYIVWYHFAFSYFPMFFFSCFSVNVQLLNESHIQQNAWGVHSCWDVMHFHSLAQFCFDGATDNNRLFGCRSKKTSKLRVTGLCEGNSMVTGKFPAQNTRNAENVSIWWCHHESSTKWHPEQLLQTKQ